MLRVAVALKIVLCNMHVAKYILYDVAQTIDSFTIPGKVDAVLRKKSLLQGVPSNIALTKFHVAKSSSDVYFSAT